MIEPPAPDGHRPHTSLDEEQQYALEMLLEKKLGFDDITDLKDMKSVVTFNCEPMTPAETRILADALIDQAPTEIEYLFLGHNQMGDEGMAALADAMANDALPNLLSVDFSKNGITDVGMASFVGAIKHCKRFRDIIMKENKLGDAGMNSLTEVLRRNEWPNIERLNLAGAMFDRHTISDASFLPFAQGLADGEFKAIRLEELEMGDNDINDAGFSALCLAIQRGNLRKLRSLYMMCNHITDDGAAALAEAITNNKRTCLFDLRLGFQNINDPDAPRVTKEGGKKLIEDAGAAMGRKIEVILTPLGL